MDGEIVGAIGVSGAPTVQNDVDCAKAALAVVRDDWLRLECMISERKADVLKHDCIPDFRHNGSRSRSF
jgi:hypothetical protein